MTVERLPGIGQCERVQASRRIVLPKVATVAQDECLQSASDKCLMVLNDVGRKAEQTLRELKKTGILTTGCYKALQDHIYLVDADAQRRSLSLDLNDYQTRVYFVNDWPSLRQHENHWGRCTADGFVCGVQNSDVWLKLLAGKAAPDLLGSKKNRDQDDDDFVVTRSYHFDCELDWTSDDVAALPSLGSASSKEASASLTLEQQQMLELGLPVTFGCSHHEEKGLNRGGMRRCDHAYVAFATGDEEEDMDEKQISEDFDENEEEMSQMVEKDYDKELANLSSSTDRMSLSRSPPATQQLLIASAAAADCEPMRSSSPAQPTPGTMTLDEFENYWTLNGQRVLEEAWRERYGDFMATGYPNDDAIQVATSGNKEFVEATNIPAKDCSDDGICSELGDHESLDERDCRRAGGESSDEFPSDEYSSEWSKLWEQLGLDMYYMLMNKLVAQEHLTATGGHRSAAAGGGGGADGSQQSGQNDQSLQSDEGHHSEHQPTADSSGAGEQQASGSGVTGGSGDGEDRGDSPSSNKRPLTVADFGLATSADEACTIERRFIKNHRLKKMKRESHNHRKDLNAVSADALLEDDAVATEATKPKPPADARLAKYWGQRYRLFHRFDAGIQLDDEGWFSVTPEKIAEHIAKRLCPRPLRSSLFTMDGFCGIGGNTIQLAARSKFVLAVDCDAGKIAMAANNARVYGVADRVGFVQADMRHFVPRIAPDSVFLSPPWGGPGYKERAAFDLDEIDTLAQMDFRAIFRAYQHGLTPNVAMLLPRNTKLDQLCELGRVEVEQNLLNNKVKTITAYYGKLICK